jgi:hypothetical protein
VKPTIVLARLKPLEQIPAKFICCEQMKQNYIDTLDEVVEVRLGTVFEAEIECRYCHRVLQDVKHMRLRERGGRFNAECIGVAAYDFDEGVSFVGAK